MNYKKNLHYIAILTCIALIATCFIPWVHYNSIDTTFNGYNVKPFSTGVNYGRAGKIITILVSISFLLTLLPYVAAKRTNMFVAALLVAYTIRTYILFTGSLFEGEVVKLAGIYLIIALSFVILICSIFPNLNEDKS
jgi:cytochrome bd-type quinol oxidase subunit 2